MRRIGLIGGMSWHSTMTYYRVINERVARQRGGHASAEICLQSVDFAAVRACQQREDWAGADALLAAAAERCVAGGADLVGLCTNLMHKCFGAIDAATGAVPAVHIADAVAAVAREHGWSTLGLLGARWVMEETFYADRLATHGLGVVVPDPAGRELVDRVVFDEITQGVFRPESRSAYARVIDDLAAAGADAVVLACTEIGLLVGADDSRLPLIDSAQVHAERLAELALADPAQVSERRVRNSSLAYAPS